jgi:UDP-N-acetylglucosamine--dolichyl-phosphate N-acetylglucosaminephosphotransferase
MLDVANLVIYGAVVSAISFFVILLLMPAAIKSLAARGRVVPDAHKRDKPMIPRPAGPVIMAGIAAAEIALYLLTMNTAVLAVLLSTAIAFAVGYIDDVRVMPGWFKPAALLAAALPIILLNLYDVGEVHSNFLNLVFGSAFIPLLYIPLVLVIIPVVGNTINSIDVLNGVASGFIIIATIPLLASIAIFGTHEAFLAALPLLFGSIAFLKVPQVPKQDISRRLGHAAVRHDVRRSGNRRRLRNNRDHRPPAGRHELVPFPCKRQAHSGAPAGQGAANGSHGRL